MLLTACDRSQGVIIQAVLCGCIVSVDLSHFSSRTLITIIGDMRKDNILQILWLLGADECKLHNDVTVFGMYSSSLGVEKDAILSMAAPCSFPIV